jgi:hypothetical protein
MSRIITVLLVLLSTGCASFNRSAAPPASAAVIPISISTALPSGMNDMPIGVYRIPDSTTYFSGHQKGLGAGMMFGLIGVAIANSANKARAENMVQDVEGSLRIDLPALARTSLTQSIQNRGLAAQFQVGDDAKQPGTASVASYVVLTFNPESIARPYVILKVARTDAATKKTWWTRYISAADEERPLAGDTGWSTNNGEPFKAAVLRALDRGLDTAVRDLAGQLPRATATEMKAKTRWAFVQQELEIAGQLVEQDAERVVFIPKIGDVVVFAGVNVFAPNMVQLAPAPTKTKK